MVKYKSSNVRVVYLTVLAVGLMFSFSGCGDDKGSHNAPAVEDKVVGRVDGQPVYLQELLESLRRSGLKPTEKNLQGVLQQMLERRASVVRLKALGLDQDKAFLEDYRLLAQEAVKKHYESTHRGELDVSDQDVESYYQQHQNEFVQPEQIRLSTIAFSPELGSDGKALQDEIWQQLMAQEAGVKRDQLFKRYAAKYSAHRASRYRGGDVGWISHDQNGQWPGGLIDQGFSLTPGEYARYSNDDQQHFIFYVSGYHAEFVKPLQDVAGSIRRRVADTRRLAMQEAMHAFIQEGIELDVNQPVLAANAEEESSAVAGFAMPKLK